MLNKKIQLFDTTLRDGSQAEGISFSLEDKIHITNRLIKLGINYLECGWPGSNPKDELFFQEIKHLPKNKTKIVAFGSTRKKGLTAQTDPNLRALVKADTPVVCIFGKTWNLHVTHALRTSLAENLKMIYDSVRYLKSCGIEVIYDAEHFFNGYLADREYAIQTLETALKSGTDWLVLCDTNGGMLPHQVREIVGTVRQKFGTRLGIHTHNDSGCAVANSITAVNEGCTMVQGTINGYGERCGNADLCVLIPNLQLKLKYNCLTKKQLGSLTEVSRFVSEVANVVPQDRQPYVGMSAFAHKGGIHVSAVSRHTATYEHINPAEVGNSRRILVSELSGLSSVVIKSKELNIDLEKENVKNILDLIKKKEHQGYSYEGAEASLKVLIHKFTDKTRPCFELSGFRVIVEKDATGLMRTEATIKLIVNDKTEHTAAEGDGPVNALDNALRKALEKFYPKLHNVSLTDFKVRVINAVEGTAAKVRVLIESRDSQDEWITVGVSENIIEASWQALVDAVEYKLLK